MGFEALFGSCWKFPLTREDVFSEDAIEPNKKTPGKGTYFGRFPFSGAFLTATSFSEADDSDLNRTASS